MNTHVLEDNFLWIIHQNIKQYEPKTLGGVMKSHGKVSISNISYLFIV